MAANGKRSSTAYTTWFAGGSRFINDGGLTSAGDFYRSRSTIGEQAVPRPPECGAQHPAFVLPRSESLRALHNADCSQWEHVVEVRRRQPLNYEVVPYTTSDHGARSTRRCSGGVRREKSSVPPMRMSPRAMCPSPTRRRRSLAVLPAGSVAAATNIAMDGVEPCGDNPQVLPKSVGGDHGRTELSWSAGST